MRFDTGKGVAEVPPERWPLQMTFGDGSPFSLDELLHWVNLYDRSGIRICWQTGDIAAFCNLRCAHGRPALELQQRLEAVIQINYSAACDKLLSSGANGHSICLPSLCVFITMVSPFMILYPPYS